MPGVPLAPQLRERIVVWRYKEGKPAAEIAELAGCSERTVYSVLRNHRDFGQTNQSICSASGIISNLKAELNHPRGKVEQSM
ncbi:hypothetical protein B0H14DRAFT_2392534 [Mycena olivaceomarginata]|nr:hypothetical protein B0H14DRAFT_2392534 [Mycena olivaceomarginata]